MHLMGISGSLRQASYNTRLVKEAAKAFKPKDFTLGDLNLPLYSGDIEAVGIPSAVQTLSDQVKAAAAVVISTPEYNSALSGVLKNALDWISRTKGNPWAGKPVAILSATAGRAGGARAQSSLRLCLQPFNPRLLNGPEVLVASVSDAFDEDGLVEGRYKDVLQTLMNDLKALV